MPSAFTVTMAPPFLPKHAAGRGLCATVESAALLSASHLWDVVVPDESGCRARCVAVGVPPPAWVHQPWPCRICEFCMFGVVRHEEAPACSSNGLGKLRRSWRDVLSGDVPAGMCASCPTSGAKLSCLSHACLMLAREKIAGMARGDRRVERRNLTAPGSPSASLLRGPPWWC